MIAPSEKYKAGVQIYREFLQDISSFALVVALVAFFVCVKSATNEASEILLSSLVTKALETLKN